MAPNIVASVNATAFGTERIKTYVIMSTMSDTRASARSKCEESRSSCLGGLGLAGVIVIVGGGGGEDWVRRGWVSLSMSDDGDSFRGVSTGRVTTDLCLNSFIATARCG